jgi:hypothetical protein
VDEGIFKSSERMRVSSKQKSERNRVPPRRHANQNIATTNNPWKCEEMLSHQEKEEEKENSRDAEVRKTENAMIYL